MGLEMFTSVRQVEQGGKLVLFQSPDNIDERVSSWPCSCYLGPCEHNTNPQRSVTIVDDHETEKEEDYSGNRA